MTGQEKSSGAPDIEAEPRGSQAPGKSQAGTQVDTAPAGVVLAPGLYVTATPIGHARDITLRALDVLHNCDLIAAEDTRVTAKLLAIYGVRKTLSAYNDHNATRERPKLLARLKHGGRVALVSDAGTPLVSDPGYKLVRDAIGEGVAVHAIPGASAALAGLALAGLPSDRFLFAGFLPSRSGERRSALEELKTIRSTVILFESPQRLAESLTDMAAVLGNRPAVIARELTKLHEEISRGLLADLARRYAGEAAPKGEITMLIGPARDEGPDLARIDTLLDQALPFMPVRAASELIAGALDIPRRAVYDRALERKRDD